MVLIKRSREESAQRRGWNYRAGEFVLDGKPGRWPERTKQTHEAGNWKNEVPRRPPPSMWGFAGAKQAVLWMTSTVPVYMVRMSPCEPRLLPAGSPLLSGASKPPASLSPHAFSYRRKKVQNLCSAVAPEWESPLL